MQAVILAAGKGTRLRPITYDVPKPMIKISGKNMMERNIEQLPEEVEELIFVVNYLSSQIVNYFGDNFASKKVKYVKQEKMLGTGDALSSCQNFLRDKFLVMNGDDIYKKEDIERCMKHDNCILTKEQKNKFSGGRITLDQNGNLCDIVEGTHEKGGLANTALYVLTKDFFNYELVPLFNKNEYGLPQTIIKMAKDFPIKIEKANFWLQVNDISDLKKARRIFEK